MPGADLVDLHDVGTAADALLGELESLVRRFNESQKDYRVVAVHKGSYEDTMIAALAERAAQRVPEDDFLLRARGRMQRREEQDRNKEAHHRTAIV